jgi:hypothetical protein
VKELLDIVVAAAFILFLIFIFAGYHASRRDQDKQE